MARSIGVCGGAENDGGASGWIWRQCSTYAYPFATDAVRQDGIVHSRWCFPADPLPCSDSSFDWFKMALQCFLKGVRRASPREFCWQFQPFEFVEPAIDEGVVHANRQSSLGRGRAMAMDFASWIAMQRSGHSANLGLISPRRGDAGEYR